MRGHVVVLSRLIVGHIRGHWRPYAASALMLSTIAVLTVWIPRQVGHVVDALVSHRLAGWDLIGQLGLLVLAGLAIYLLRVGWRLALFRTAYELGRQLRMRLYAQLTNQGPALLPRPAHRRPDGAGEQRRRRHRDGRGRGAARRLRRLADADAGARHDDDRRRLAPRAGRAGALPVHGLRVLAHLDADPRRLLRFAEAFLRAEPAGAGQRSPACAPCARSASCGAVASSSASWPATPATPPTRRSAGRRCSSRPSACPLGAATVIALGVGALARRHGRHQHRPVDRVHDVPRPVDLADVRRGLGAVAAGTRTRRLVAAAAGAGCTGQPGGHRDVRRPRARRHHVGARVLPLPRRDAADARGRLR